MAAGLVAGDSRAKIAKREKVCVRTVSRLANHPETRLLMAQLLRPHRDKIVALVARCIEVIAESLDAHHVYVTKDGTVVDAGGDTFARLAAVKRLLELVEAARTEKDEGQLKVTWEMFLDLCREVDPEFQR